jgi:Ca-activated chloride channel family protein
MVVWYVMQHRKLQAGMQISTVQPFAKLPVGWKVKLRHVPFALRVITVLLLVFILARPQSSNSWRNTTTEGIDIMMTLDISSSMLARDFKPNRIEAAKEVASTFISGRPSDNIGLVVFSGESFTQCPLTTDHAVLLNLFSGIQSGQLEDGTAIGLGLANAVTRLKDSKAKSKVIILLTDGSNNMGNIAPITAAEIAKTFGIRVYTIGVGTQGVAPYPVQTPYGIRYQNMPVEIDESILKRIAGMTGGTYFRATGNSKLKAVYDEIDQLEKTKLNVQEINKKHEEYTLLAWIAFFFLLSELLLRYFVLRKIP